MCVAAQAIEIAREVWHSRLPVVFVLAPGEVSTLEAPKPFHVRHCICCFEHAAIDASGVQWRCRGPPTMLPSRARPALWLFAQTMVSRQTYLPLALFPALPSFQHAVAAVLGTRDLWLEHNGVPLKWYLRRACVRTHIGASRRRSLRVVGAGTCPLACC